MSQKVYVYQIVNESDMMVGTYKTFTKLDSEAVVALWAVNNLRAEVQD